MWWPNPEDLQDLEIEETEEGFSLSAPEDTKCALWLKHYSQSEELRSEFEAEFQKCLENYIKEQDGESQVSYQPESDCPGREEDSTGLQS